MYTHDGTVHARSNGEAKANAVQWRPGRALPIPLSFKEVSDGVIDLLMTHLGFDGDQFQVVLAVALTMTEMSICQR